VGPEVHNLRVATLKKVLISSLGAVVGFFLGALVWYVVLEVVGVDGLTRYLDQSPRRSYLWEVVMVFAGPAIGLLAGSVLGWRLEAGTQRSVRRR
jgi:hypothetical protein